MRADKYLAANFGRSSSSPSAAASAAGSAWNSLPRALLCALIAEKAISQAAAVAQCTGDDKSAVGGGVRAASKSAGESKSQRLKAVAAPVFCLGRGGKSPIFSGIPTPAGASRFHQAAHGWPMFME